MPGSICRSNKKLDSLIQWSQPCLTHLQSIIQACQSTYNVSPISRYSISLSLMIKGWTIIGDLRNISAQTSSSLDMPSDAWKEPLLLRGHRINFLKKCCKAGFTNAKSTHCSVRLAAWRGYYKKLSDSTALWIRNGLPTSLTWCWSSKHKPSKVLSKGKLMTFFRLRRSQTCLQSLL